MIVNSTDLKNNLGKYLRQCAKEEITITNNGRKIAVLKSFEEPEGFYSKLFENGSVSEKQAEAFNLEQKKMTYEEFLAFNENTQKRYEYIDGSVYLLASPGIIHQKILGELYVILHNWFKGKKCTPFLAPFDITLKKGTDNINVVQPDLTVICDLEKNRDKNDKYWGVPVLAVEIISRSTQSRDTIKKLDIYMSSGVCEYWMVNPAIKEICVYFFKNKDINKSQTFKNDETLKSYYFAGLELKLKAIF